MTTIEKAREQKQWKKWHLVSSSRSSSGSTTKPSKIKYKIHTIRNQWERTHPRLRHKWLGMVLCVLLCIGHRMKSASHRITKSQKCIEKLFIHLLSLRQDEQFHKDDYASGFSIFVLHVRLHLCFATEMIRKAKRENVGAKKNKQTDSPKRLWKNMTNLVPSQFRKISNIPSAMQLPHSWNSIIAIKQYKSIKSTHSPMPSNGIVSSKIIFSFIWFALSFFYYWNKTMKNYAHFATQ